MSERPTKQKQEKQRSLRELFLEAAKPDELGHTEWMTIEALVAIDPRFATGNGGSWCRDDGPLRDYRIERRKKGNKIDAVRLTGTQVAPKERQINPAVKKEVVKKRCAILDVGSNIECDHKDGRYDSHKMLDLSKQTAADFQPLSKAANMAKRQHCKTCKESGKRYDAKRLGYSVGWIGGDDDYDKWGCGGCYWHDPKFFNGKVSKKP